MLQELQAVHEQGDGGFAPDAAQDAEGMVGGPTPTLFLLSQSRILDDPGKGRDGIFTTAHQLLRQVYIDVEPTRSKSISEIFGRRLCNGLRAGPRFAFDQLIIIPSVNLQDVFVPIFFIIEFVGFSQPLQLLGGEVGFPCPRVDAGFPRCITMLFYCPSLVMYLGCINP